MGEHVSYSYDFVDTLVKCYVYINIYTPIFLMVRLSVGSDQAVVAVLVRCYIFSILDCLLARYEAHTFETLARRTTVSKQPFPLSASCPLRFI